MECNENIHLLTRGLLTAIQAEKQGNFFLNYV